MGFLHNITLKISSLVLEFVKDKKKSRCDLVDNKITFLLNSVMAFVFLVLEWECFGWALGRSSC